VSAAPEARRFFALSAILAFRLKEVNEKSRRLENKTVTIALQTKVWAANEPPKH